MGRSLMYKSMKIYFAFINHFFGLKLLPTLYSYLSDLLTLMSVEGEKCCPWLGTHLLVPTRVSRLFPPNLPNTDKTLLL